MTEPVEPKRGAQPAPAADPWRPPPTDATAEHPTEHPTEQLGWGAAGARSWSAPPPEGPRAEPHTVFLGNTFDPPATPPPARRSARGALSATGLLLAGLLVGAVAVWAVQSQSSDAAATGASDRFNGSSGPGNGLPFGQNNGNGQVPGGSGQVPGGSGNGGFGGGLAGEQRLVGTITAVGSRTVTVEARSGSTQTYTVGSGTEIVRNGNRARLSDLKAGDLAFLHVYPQGSTMMVERIFAGQLPGGGAGLPGFGGGRGAPDRNGPGGSTGGGTGTTT